MSSKLRLMIIRSGIALILAFLISIPGTLAQNTIPCNADPEFKKLDFLVGDWLITDKSGEKRIAESNFRKISKGCAFMEERVDMEGFVANSLIYFNLDEYSWKQVWISESPRSRGGVKEKVMDDFAPVNSISFSGSHVSKSGTYIHERMMFTRKADGNFSQKIETSTDGGMHWEVTFEGIYMPNTSPSLTVSSAERFRSNN